MSPASLRIGLVNNVPDMALQTTERQFTRLLAAAAAAAAQDISIEVTRFALTEIPRGRVGEFYLRRHYAPASVLYESQLDAVIITGAEPRTSDMRQESYWEALASVFDWAEANTISTVASCLAAHAAVLHFDGIPRRRLDRKYSGVFRQEPRADDPLIAGVGFPQPVPHSRWNDLSEAALHAYGYRVLTGSRTAGVDLFVRARRNLLVCFQGHPEYDADTLLREYHRDVARFAAGETSEAPDPPCDYFPAETERSVMAFDARLRAQGPDTGWQMPAFAEWSTDLQWRWRDGAVAIYRNWLRLVAAEKERRAVPEGYSSEPPPIAPNS